MWIELFTFKHGWHWSVSVHSRQFKYTIYNNSQERPPWGSKGNQSPGRIVITWSYVELLSKSSEIDLRAISQRYISLQSLQLVSKVIFKLIPLVIGWGILCEIACGRLSLALSPFYVAIYGISRPQWVNAVRPRQNGWHFLDNILKCTFWNESKWISLNISEICS